MKPIIAFLLITSTAHADYVTSSVTFESNLWHYHYVVPSKINNKELNGVTVGLNPWDLDDIHADDKFKLELFDDSVKFDDIKPNGDTFVFGFTSPFAPSMSWVSLKAGNTTYTESLIAPIPEPSTACFAVVGVLGLLNLKRRKS